MAIRDDIVEPYWFHPYERNKPFPGLDFNRELVPPGTFSKYPEGAVGIRVDDDFWAMAALPWKYADTPLFRIVKELWPECVAEGVTYGPDSDDPSSDARAALLRDLEAS